MKTSDMAKFHQELQQRAVSCLTLLLLIRNKVVGSVHEFITCKVKMKEKKISFASLGKQSESFPGFISYSVQCYEAAEPSNLQTAEITLLYIQF